MARPKGDIEQRLLAKARQCFLAHGFGGTSLRQVAREAGTSVGMIHYYYRSKEGLFQAVVEAVYQRTLADLEKALAPDAPFGVRVARLYAKLGSLSDEERETARMVVREAMTSPNVLQALLERSLRGHIPLLLGLVADGQREGKVRHDLSPPLVMACIMGLGVVPTFMRRAGTQYIGPSLAKSNLPAPLKAMVKAAVDSLPSQAEMTTLLGTIALAAVRPPGA
jgi:TetR/AcrR family transcriptional regulator